MLLVLHQTHNSHSIFVEWAKDRYQVFKSCGRKVKHRKSETGRVLRKVHPISTYCFQFVSFFFNFLLQAKGLFLRNSSFTWEEQQVSRHVVPGLRNPPLKAHVLLHCSCGILSSLLNCKCHEDGALLVLLTSGSPVPCTWELLNKYLWKKEMKEVRRGPEKKGT